MITRLRLTARDAEASEHRWTFLLKIDEDNLIEQLNKLLAEDSGSVKLDRVEAHLLVRGIVCKKAAQLVQTQTGRETKLLFSDFESVHEDVEEAPMFEKAGLSIWMEKAST
jgi:hypothetical protein